MIATVNKLLIPFPMLSQCSIVLLLPLYKTTMIGGAKSKGSVGKMPPDSSALVQTPHPFFVLKKPDEQ
jgi:hypothetical protein